MSRAAWRPELAAVASGCVASTAILLHDTPPALTGGGAAVLLFVMIAWIAWQDARTFSIPDGPLVAITLVGAALRLADPLSGVPDAALSIVIDGCLCGGGLLIIRETYFRLKGVDGLGFGDVKLALAGGVLVGTVAFAHALLLASALGLAVVLAHGMLKRGAAIDRLPFGAYLAPACGIVWVVSRL